ncbi:MAG: hypothetical protein K5857_00820 [Lachnospiraceae bacterium]|nr:hypothetical protein [Lachnospiraceae bacterium]
MTPMEITLLIIGVVIFCLSFILKDKNVNAPQGIDENKLREEVRRIVDKEFDGLNLKVKEATDSSIEYAMEKSERALEKISNEKIMAVNEYSNTIMEEINKNHQEVLFLYDMLSDKQTDLKNTVRKAEATAKEVKDANKKVVRQKVTRVKSEPVTEPAKGGEKKEEKRKVAAIIEDGLTDQDKESNNKRIIELHQKGRTNVEIAKELNLGVGEVSLVIDLFKR